MWKIRAAVLAAGCAAGPKPASVSEGDDDVSSTILPVDADDDGAPAGVDCDDADPDVYPGAPDRCGDDRVTDCDRRSDDGLVTVAGVGSFTRLEEALNVAPAGSEVLVCPGTYVGSFWATAAVDLVSYGGNAVTILDGGFDGTTLSVPHDSSVTGFTIVGGVYDGPGGGLRLVNAGALTVTDCEIRDNQADVGGGLSLPLGSTAVISGTTIAENYAIFGGGIHAVASTIDLGDSVVSGNRGFLSGGGVALAEGALIGGTLTGNSSEGNFLLLPGNYQGGGGLAAVGTVVVTGTDIGGNEAGGGGGVSVVSGDLRLVDVSVHDNVVVLDGTGGGASVFEGRLVLEGTSEIRANTARWGAGVAITSGALDGGLVADNEAGRWGGGLYLTDAEISGTRVTGNTSKFGGGGWIWGRGEFVDVVFDGNSADDGGGLGVFPSYPPATVLVTITGGSFTKNGAERGGAVSATLGELMFDGVLLADNTAEDGAALDLQESTATVSGSTVVRNVASGRAGGAMVGGSTLVSVGTDWGTAGDDNVPADVDAGEQPYADYGPAASFTCDNTGCTTIL